MSGLSDIIQAIPNGCGIKIEFDGDDTVAKGVKQGELVSIMTNPGRACVVCLMDRPGGMYFLRYLELEHYPPESDRETLMDLYYYKLDDLPMYMITIPVEEENRLEEVAKITGMVLKRGYQMISINNGETNELFPATDNVLVLQNETGHLVYTSHRLAVIQQIKDIGELEIRHFGHTC